MVWWAAANAGQISTMEQVLAHPNPYWRDPNSVRNGGYWGGGLKDGYSFSGGEGWSIVGEDRNADLIKSYVYARPAQPAAAAAPPPQAPVIEAKPAPELKADAYRKKPEQEGAVKAPGYQIDSKASAYEKWLADPKSDGRSGDSEAPSFGGGGGDRVRFYQEKMEREQPDATVAGRYSEAGDGGGRRMAGSAMFKERLNRYRS